MSEKHEEGLLSGVSRFLHLLNSGASEQELNDFAKSDDAEEVFFNIDPSQIAPEQRQLAKKAAQNRLAHLKAGFKHGGGRNMPGKMEYDTIKEALNDAEWN